MQECHQREQKVPQAVQAAGENVKVSASMLVNIFYMHVYSFKYDRRDQIKWGTDCLLISCVGKNIQSPGPVEKHGKRHTHSLCNRFLRKVLIMLIRKIFKNPCDTNGFTGLNLV